MTNGPEHFAACRWWQPHLPAFLVYYHRTTYCQRMWPPLDAYPRQNMDSSNSQWPEEAASETEQSEHERTDVEKDKAGRLRSVKSPLWWLVNMSVPAELELAKSVSTEHYSLTAMLSLKLNRIPGLLTLWTLTAVWIHRGDRTVSTERRRYAPHSVSSKTERTQYWPKTSFTRNTKPATVSLTSCTVQ